MISGRNANVNIEQEMEGKTVSKIEIGEYGASSEIRKGGQGDFIIDLTRRPEEIEKAEINSRRNIRPSGDQVSRPMLIMKRKRKKSISDKLQMALSWGVRR